MATSLKGSEKVDGQRSEQFSLSSLDNNKNILLLQSQSRLLILANVASTGTPRLRNVQEI